MKRPSPHVPPLIAPVFAMAFALVSSAARYETFPVFPPFPESSGARPDATSVVLEFAIDASRDRAYWDFPINGGLPLGATALEVEASLVADAVPAGFSMHLRSNGAWYDAAPTSPDSARRRIGVPLRRFRDASGAICEATRADKLRISLWGFGRPLKGRINLHAVRARADAVAIAEIGDAASIDRVRALFDRAGIPYADLDASLGGAEAFAVVALPQLPDYPAPAVGQTLRAASRSGTAFLAFYTASPLLAETLGIKPGGWTRAPRQTPWTAIQPDARRLGGFSESIPHETANLIPPYEAEGVYAAGYWVGESGRAGPVPACVVSDRGAWFAHVPPLPTRPACEWTRRIVLKFAPDLATVFAVNALMENEALVDARPSPSLDAATAIRDAVTRRHKLEEVPLLCARLRDAAAAGEAAVAAAPTNEWRATWDERAPVRTVASWRAALGGLRDGGVNTVFAFAQIGGGALFGPGSSETSRMSLDRLVAEARKAGVAVHAWMQVLSLGGSDPAAIAALAAEDRLVVPPPGLTAAPWLCPDHAANRAMLAEAAARLAVAGVAGVHLDYIRLEQSGGCVCKASRAAYERRTGRKVEAWPDDVVGEGILARDYAAFETASVTALVREIAAAVHAATNGVALSAAVYPDRQTAARLGQDWPGWVEAGLLDVLCPMNYEHDAARFAARLDEIAAACPAGRVAVVAGIGTGASSPGPDALDAARQIATCRKRGLGGFAFFHLDDLLLGSILPSLRLNESARVSSGGMKETEP